MRWSIQAQGAESSGDARSDFYFQRYHDAGTFAANALVISRATGAVTIAGTLIEQAATATATAEQAQVTGDAQPRYSVRADGLLAWGPGGSTATDTTLQRTGVGALRVDTRLALGINLSPWGSGPILQVANSGIRAALDYPYVGLTNNTYYDGTNFRAVGPTNNAAGMLEMTGGACTFSGAPAVAG